METGPGLRRRTGTCPGFNSATACYAVETITSERIATAEGIALQFGHGLLCRGNKTSEGEAAGVLDASIRPRLVMPWKHIAPHLRGPRMHAASIRPRLVMPWKPGRPIPKSTIPAASIRPRLVMPWKHLYLLVRGCVSTTLQFGHGLLCRGNKKGFVHAAEESFALQFGHGLLCRGNIGAAPQRFGEGSGFNSATACYAVETRENGTLSRAEYDASIRPRLVMPWKLFK